MSSVRQYSAHTYEAMCAEYHVPESPMLTAWYTDMPTGGQND